MLLSSSEKIRLDKLDLEQQAHDTELADMIAQGWGDTDQASIPDDWRVRKGPDTAARREKLLGRAVARRVKLTKPPSERVFFAGITERQCHEIMELMHQLSYRELAARFHTSRTMIWRIFKYMKTQEDK